MTHKQVDNGTIAATGTSVLVAHQVVKSSLQLIWRPGNGFIQNVWYAKVDNHLQAT